jgi:hypothetical protein
MSQDLLDWGAYVMKRSKDDIAVQYQDYPRYQDYCGICQMFVPPSGCTAVHGPVIGKGHCFLFKKKAVKQQLKYGE